MEVKDVIPERRLDISREEFDVMMKRRFFFGPSFQIYGGVKGLYDLGPPGTAIKANLLAEWRNHFILEDDMLELELTCITPARVFQVSGHTAKFEDFMVKNPETKACYRADHLLEAHLEKLMENPKLDAETRQDYLRICAQVDDYDQESLGELIRKFDIKDPEDGGELSDVFPFNLMFDTQIGPQGDKKGYLRPETAQGIFVNFPKLLEYNGGRIPMAGATIGTAYRNEISPQQGLLRRREFTLAEIEHFVDPDDKTHPKFDTVADLEMVLFPKDNQTTSGKMIIMKVGDAVEQGLIANETLAYFMARTWMFLIKLGGQARGMRMRQHLQNEMAHYACDCWDAEMLTTYGWVECVGHADRACYDLSVHAAATDTSMQFFKKFDEPVVVQALKPKISKSVIGKTFKREAKPLLKHLETLDDDACTDLREALDKTGAFVVEVDNKEFKVTGDMCSFEVVENKVSGKKITPSVIEPAFGIGRIMYGLLEHSFWIRDPADATKKLSVDDLLDIKKKSAKTEIFRGVLSLSPYLASVKCSVLPLFSSSEEMVLLCKKISQLLKNSSISQKLDSSSQNIGRRYSRMDELGIPFGVTVDHASVTEDDPLFNTVTLRERDTTLQVRVPVDEVVPLLQAVLFGNKTWTEASKSYDKHE